MGPYLIKPHQNQIISFQSNIPSQAFHQARVLKIDNSTNIKTENKPNQLPKKTNSAFMNPSKGTNKKVHIIKNNQYIDKTELK